MINGGDRFGQTGTPKELMAAYGLDAAGGVMEGDPAAMEEAILAALLEKKQN